MTSLAASQPILLPIREISSYCPRTWCIVGRVTQRSGVRQFNTAGSSGQVFSVDILDKEGTEIRASFFNKAVGAYNGIIETGKVFKFSKGTIKVANKKYTNIQHNYELVFDENAVVEEVMDEGLIGTATYHISLIRDIATKKVPCQVDLLAVVKEIKPLTSITVKQTNEQLPKRNVIIADKSDCSIDLTLFGDLASNFTLPEGASIFVKNVNIREYNGGKFGSTSANSTLQHATSEFCPGLDIEISDLQAWSASSASSASLTSVSQTSGSGTLANGRLSLGGAPTKECNISEIKSDCTGLIPSSGLTFETTGYLHLITTKSKDGDVPIYYNACKSCNRKVSDDCRCVSCDKNLSPDQIAKRFMIRAQFSDHTDDAYFSIFNEQAQAILGNKTVEDVLLESNPSSHDAKENLIGEYLQTKYLQDQWNLKLKAVSSEYKGESRAKVNVVSCEKINDFVARGKFLLKKIHAMFPGLANDSENVDMGNHLRKRKFEDIELESMSHNNQQY
jgi:replication factor A1